jgi:hypothetical protein
MRRIFVTFSTLAVFLLSGRTAVADIYPDQHYVYQMAKLVNCIESQSAIQLSADSTCFMLADSATYGYLILRPDTADFPFNRGLPSWNGTAVDENCGFLVQMRFGQDDGWSPWLTAGFWKAYIWGSYGQTSYSGGYIDYDYVKLNQYQNRWQFKIFFARYAVTDPSPTLHKLSFYISDTGTTENIDYTALLNDNPEEIFIPTNFLYQYDIDPDIGGDICSPTSVSMVLSSYGIPVNPLQFAQDNYDPYNHMFGIWPRAVQNASEYGLNGAVTRYRNWSEAREVLAAGGRIVITVGPPLYTGHLMMLAGFNSSGNPIVHDPARRDGYAKVYNKNDLAVSWFSKGGISYTFFPADMATAIPAADILASHLPDNYQLFQNYPNPFNPTTTVTFSVAEQTEVKIAVYDIRGRLVEILFDKTTQAGKYSVVWDAEDLASGNYFIVFSTADYYRVIKAVLIR